MRHFEELKIARNNKTLLIKCIRRVLESETYYLERYIDLFVTRCLEGITT
jgi:hypothetical protein